MTLTIRVIRVIRGRFCSLEASYLGNSRAIVRFVGNFLADLASKLGSADTRVRKSAIS